MNNSTEKNDPCCSKNAVPNTALMPDIKANANEVLTIFKVLNMDCADEIKAINESLQTKGIHQIQANLMSSTIKILHDPEITKTFLIKRIETTVVRVTTDGTASTHSQNKNRIILVTFSGIFLSFGILLNWLELQNSFTQMPFFISILLGGKLIFPKTLGALKRKTLDMNVLMSIAVIGAVCIRENAEASAVVFLFSLSELLESLSVQRARSAIQELLNIAPKMATLVKSDESTETKNVEEIRLSDIIRIKAGESIPLDGIVLNGSSSVNQAPLTGESVPVFKTSGASVFAGTINRESSLEIQVNAIFSNTKISQVIKMVEEAQSKRAPSQTFVDRFSEIYTPTILVLSVLTFAIPTLFFDGNWMDWLYKSLVLLVIACPCALVISTPVSIVSSLTALAKQGVLVKGGAVLETLGTIRALALDKTGTLTVGKPKVHQIIALNSYSEDTILQIAASIETHSTHPLAQTILKLAKDKNLELKVISEFTNIAGLGVDAIIDNHEYLLGNHRFAHQMGICTPDLEKLLESLEEHSLSVVIVGHKPHGDCKGEIIGVIALGDQIKTEAKAALQKIKDVGIKKIIILSGDNQKTVSAISAQLGISEAIGDLLPEDKVTQIEALKKEFGTVAMIGDGINDAPAMALSSLGIAMGFAGSDTAVETADAVLMRDDLTQIAVAVRAGRRTLKIIQFNISFALVTKAIFLVLTVLGRSNLWIAVAADTGAALFVIMNSMRLLKINTNE